MAGRFFGSLRAFVGHNLVTAQSASNLAKRSSICRVKAIFYASADGPAVPAPLTSPALTYEREMTRAGVEVFYALTAGDQTSPEGRLIRHMFQVLDQFEVEKLGREVRRGQSQIRLKALASSAFGEMKHLSDLGGAGDPALSTKAIPLRGFEPRFPD